MAQERRYRIAILGGSGPQGSGLALRLAKAGHEVTIGSRDAQRAAATAAQLSQRIGKPIAGQDNRAAAALSEIVLLTVPYAAQRGTVISVLNALQGKLLIDATVPLLPPKVGTVELPQGRSAVAAIQHMVGESVHVISAFQNVSARHLNDLDHDVDCDVLICGNDRAACDIVIALCAQMGLRGFYAGGIENSAAAEALTSVLITINRRYKVPGAGIRITGVPGPSPSM
jgi:8-hydroxy-5-deazaflavin:NADPH oxidoreductase